MTFSIANLSLGIIFIFNIFEYYRAFSCSAAELCVISNVVQCNSIINSISGNNYLCALDMICSDGAEFRDIADTDEIPYTNNYIYWDKESIIAQNIITRMFFINFAILYIYWQCC